MVQYPSLPISGDRPNELDLVGGGGGGRSLRSSPSELKPSKQDLKQYQENRRARALARYTKVKYNKPSEWLGLGSVQTRGTH